MTFPGEGPRKELSSRLAERLPAHEPSGIAEWVGVFLPPAAFFVHLQVGLVLVPLACANSQNLWLHADGVASIALAMFGTVVAWRAWESAGGSIADRDSPAWARTRFLGATGLGMGANLTLILLAQWATAFFISPCQ